MFKKHKSFDLNKIRVDQKGERLNHPKKGKYFKYFIIPAIIAFSLLCILMNVNFSGNDPYTTIKSKQKNNISTSEKSLYLNKNPKIEIFSTIIYENGSTSDIPKDIFKANPLNSQSLQYKQNTFTANLVGAISCQEFKANCTLICKNGNVNFMEENLNDLQEKCRGIDINLILENCEFTNGVLQQSFFYGFFSLAYLSITKCNLQMIKSQAFKTKNVNNLKTLILQQNQLSTLESTTFEGLSMLENFEFVQTALSSVSFKGDLFFQPLTNRLQEARLQPCINDSVAIDPLSWWQDLQMIALAKLDLSNTNLENNLNEETFLNFISLEYLILFNCNLLTFKGVVFDSLSYKLKYLDLRLNHLKTLDLMFLEKMVTLDNLNIELSLNDWYCECDTEMLKYLQEHDDKITEEMICLTPAQWQEMTLMQVIEECKEGEITTMPDTTTLSTSLTDTSSTSEADINTFTTEPTTQISTSTTSTSVETTTISNVDTSSFSTDTTTQNSMLKTTTSIGSSRPTTTPTFNETSSVSTENMNTTTTTVSTSSITTESTTKISIHSTTTTTTLSPPNLINIDCKINQHNGKFSMNIMHPNAKYSITTTSPTSVTINVQTTSNLQKFSIIYFNNQTDYKDVFVTPNFKIKSVKGKILIENLNTSTAYIFCGIADSTIRISPFDCKAHFVEEFYNLKATWLTKSHQVWFFLITSTISLILFCLSLLLVYCLLRHNPHWIINRNKRILQIHNDPKKVLILSRKFSDVSERSSNYLKSLPFKENQETDIANSLYSSQLTVPITQAPIKPLTRIYSESCVRHNKFKDLGELRPDSSRSSKYLQPLAALPPNAKENFGNALYSSKNTVPSDKAPIKTLSATFIPNKRTCYKSSCSPVSRFRKSQKVYTKTMDYLNVIDNEPEYQTIDYYETINF